jgi:hypothetical protein
VVPSTVVVDISSTGLGGRPELSVPIASVLGMESRQVMAGLAELAPGPELSAALAAVDVARVANGELLRAHLLTGHRALRGGHLGCGGADRSPGGAGHVGSTVAW